MPRKINDGLTNRQRYLKRGDNHKKCLEHGKEWRQTDRGKFIRNKNHWKSSGIREPLESWDKYWEKFKLETKCNLCNVTFDLENANKPNGRCLDHHHHSGYIRNVICRNCNSTTMIKFDKNHNKVLFELQRYFRTNLNI